MSGDIVQDMRNIASRVNAMSEYEVRHRLREFDCISMDEMYLEEIVEINYLSMKLLGDLKRNP